MEEIVKQFLETRDREEQEKIYIYAIGKSNGMAEFHSEIKKQVKNLSKKYYFYLITFTVREEEKKNIDLIEEYIVSQMKRPALKIVFAEYVKEYTKKGMPHFHFAVKSERFIAKNRFNYYTQKYGFIDISKSTNKSLEESINYINKDTQSIKIT